MTNARGKRRAARVRVLLSAFALVSLLASFGCAGGPDTAPGAVHVLTTDGEVNPVMYRYIDRGIDNAEKHNAAAVVIRLDTPGGLLSSMDDIIERILDSKVPVIVYVWPSGGEAASAGTYITYASHVAAMAPGTVIGSATPISSSGDNLDSDLRNKLIGNSVSKIRGLAELRGRNADWGEQAVREGISAHSGEAVDLHIVEYVAEDLPSLLQQINGREVTLQNGSSVTLATADAQVAYNNMTLAEHLLNLIANANIAFLLLSLGSLAIFIEILHPGSIFPGVFGIVALILAFFSLSVLPFNWAGVALIAFAFVLFGLEMFITSHGILGIGGAISLVLGGLFLTNGSEPNASVSPWVIAVVAVPMLVLVLTVFVNIMRIRRMPAKMGLETVVGRTVVARSALTPQGFVFMDGENWQAEAEDGNVQPGEKVIVTQIRGLRLKVRRKPEGA
ncbi:MAG TPA: nodulation protein NfeD [Dehalococcoidia bacterium]|nr:nodulation protein NfeD [Dehalococcoidia bacterium]